MRLTVVNSTAPGAASLLAPFFEALVEQPGLELTVLEQMGCRPPISIPGAKGDQECRTERGYRVLPVPTHFYNRRHAAAQAMTRTYRRLLLDSHPDVIYVLGEPGYLSTFQVVIFATRALPKAKLCLLAAQNVYQRFPPPFPSIERYVLGKLDHAFALGRDHELVLCRKGYRGPVTQLPLGLDTRVFTPAMTPSVPAAAGLPRPVVGYVGDFLEARDLPLLIQAIAQCTKRMGLLLVGDGPTKRQLEALAGECGIRPRTRFVGSVPHYEVPAYMNSIDILVLPSKAIHNRCFGFFHIANAEQFGRVLVEAMACGKAVVGSSCGEIPSVIGDAGRVFREGDVSDLLRILEELASNPVLRQELGERALVRVKTYYDWRVIAERFVAALRNPTGLPRADLTGVR